MFCSLEMPKQTRIPSNIRCQSFLIGVLYLIRALSLYEDVIRRGRPYVYPTILMVQLYIIKSWMRIPSNNMLHYFLFIKCNNDKLLKVCRLQQIPDRRTIDPDSTNELIKEIADWLNIHSTTKAVEFFKLVWGYNTWPALKLTILYRLGFKKRVKRTLNEWYALDTHPDYAEESEETSAFLQQVMNQAVKNLLDSLRAQKKDKKKKEKNQKK